MSSLFESADGSPVIGGIVIDDPAEIKQEEPVEEEENQDSDPNKPDEDIDSAKITVVQDEEQQETEDNDDFDYGSGGNETDSALLAEIRKLSNEIAELKKGTNVSSQRTAEKQKLQNDYSKYYARLEELQKAEAAGQRVNYYEMMRLDKEMDKIEEAAQKIKEEEAKEQNPTPTDTSGDGNMPEAAKKWQELNGYWFNNKENALWAARAQVIAQEFMASGKDMASPLTYKELDDKMREEGFKRPKRPGSGKGKKGSPAQPTNSKSSAGQTGSAKGLTKAQELVAAGLTGKQKKDYIARKLKENEKK